MKVPIPFIDESIDFSDPTDAAMTAATVGGGFVLFYIASALGREGADRALEATGVQDDGDSVEVL